LVEDGSPSPQRGYANVRLSAAVWVLKINFAFLSIMMAFSSGYAFRNVMSGSTRRRGLVARLWTYDYDDLLTSVRMITIFNIRAVTLP
jgi:hypothetical protein